MGSKDPGEILLFALLFPTFLKHAGTVFRVCSSELYSLHCVRTCTNLELSINLDRNEQFLGNFVLHTRSCIGLYGTGRR